MVDDRLLFESGLEGPASPILLARMAWAMMAKKEVVTRTELLLGRVGVFAVSAATVAATAASVADVVNLIRLLMGK